jgi:hypothetical protein
LDQLHHPKQNPPQHNRAQLHPTALVFISVNFVERLVGGWGTILELVISSEESCCWSGVEGVHPTGTPV